MLKNFRRNVAAALMSANLKLANAVLPQTDTLKDGYRLLTRSERRRLDRMRLQGARRQLRKGLRIADRYDRKSGKAPLSIAGFNRKHRTQNQRLKSYELQPTPYGTAIPLEG